jgi:hypothetical protein
MSSMLFRGETLVLEVMGTESVAAGYGEENLNGDVGEEERDWNSGLEAAMGASEGISMASRRWRASFCAERSMYFCIDAF